MTDFTLANVLGWGDGSSSNLVEYARANGNSVQDTGLAAIGVGFLTQGAHLLTWGQVTPFTYIDIVEPGGTSTAHFNTDTTLTDPMVDGVYGLKTDATNRVYVFGLDASDNWIIARFNADGSADQSWVLSPDPLGTIGNITSFVGCDVSPDGRYAYMLVDTTGDPADNIHISKFDLDIPVTATGADFAWLGPRVTSGSSPGNGVTFWGGIAVNVISGDVAFGVYSAITTADPGGDIVTRKYWIYVYNSSGSIVSQTLIAQSGPNGPGGTVTNMNFGDAGFGQAGFSMVWDRSDGTTVWTLLEKDAVAGGDLHTALVTQIETVKERFFNTLQYEAPLWIYSPPAGAASSRTWGTVIGALGAGLSSVWAAGQRACAAL